MEIVQVPANSILVTLSWSIRVLEYLLFWFPVRLVGIRGTIRRKATLAQR